VFDSSVITFEGMTDDVKASQEEAQFIYLQTAANEKDLQWKNALTLGFG
jgi:hypothetical protein